MPWALAKEEDKKDSLATVLYNLIEGINIGASLLEPFMPETSKKILQQINAEARALTIWKNLANTNQVIRLLKSGNFICQNGHKGRYGKS